MLMNWEEVPNDDGLSLSYDVWIASWENSVGYSDSKSGAWNSCAGGSAAQLKDVKISE